jgi:CHAD domain-containing protein
MADGKWIPDLTPDTPVAGAARRVLGMRLQIVCDRLPAAVDHWRDDLEHVHQLRVGTRRAGAALHLFAACLPGRAYRAARKRLRRLRRAAGAARDWDVFGSDLTRRLATADAGDRPGLDGLLGYVWASRVAAQEKLAEAAASQVGELEHLLARTVSAVHRPRGKDAPRALADLAVPVLADRVQELEEAAARDPGDYDNLHQVRIAGKRLRYALEVFADCFGQGFRDGLYPEVEELQEVLGRANDSHVAVARLTALRDQLRQAFPLEWGRLAPGIEGLLAEHERRLPEERQRFLDWWARWQESGGAGRVEALLKSETATSAPAGG